MTASRLRVLSALALAVTCVVTTAGAQEGQRRSRAGQDAGTPAGEAALSTKDSLALANALDHFAVVQAQRTLELSEPQYAQFVPRLRELQQLKRRNFQARNRLLQELRRLVRAGRGGEGEPDDAALTATLQKLRENDERAASELKAAYDALDAVMTPRQRARFRLFEEQIEGRKLELLMNARTRAARGGS